MKKTLIAVLALLSILCISGCFGKSNKIISDSKAKEIITGLYDNVVISDASLGTKNGKTMYGVTFTIDKEEYIGYVDAVTGQVTSVESYDEGDDAFQGEPTPSLDDPEILEEEEPESGVSSGKALNIAKTDSGTEGPTVLVKNEYGPEDDAYNIILKDSLKEYIYKIDGTTGEILSKEVEIDS